MNRKYQASLLRNVRKIHRTLGVFLFIFFLILSLTGLMLGWKKNITYLQYPTQKGTSLVAENWLSLDTLVHIANEALVKELGQDISIEIDKLDLRPSKGIVKVIYADHYYSLQLDLTTGDVLSLEYRRSDLVEHLHDGTWLDINLGIPGGIFKLFYTTLLASSLIGVVITGFWLWYGPKILRKR